MELDRLRLLLSLSFSREGHWPVRVATCQLGITKQICCFFGRRKAKAARIMTTVSCQFCLFCFVFVFLSCECRGFYSGEKRFLVLPRRPELLLSFTSVQRRRHPPLFLSKKKKENLHNGCLQLPAVWNGSIPPFWSLWLQHRDRILVWKISSVCRLCEHFPVWGI